MLNVEFIKLKNMKKHFYLLAMVFALTIINSTCAKADDLLGGILGGLLGGGSPPSGGSQSTPLPINGGVVFLVIAAVVIGFMAIRKAKPGAIPTKG